MQILAVLLLICGPALIVGYNLNRNRNSRYDDISYYNSYLNGDLNRIIYNSRYLNDFDPLIYNSRYLNDLDDRNADIDYDNNYNEFSDNSDSSSDSSDSSD